MVEPVGREYNRRLSADDARDALCEASRHDFSSSSSSSGAACLDDWIRNGSTFASEPRYASELLSNASAAGGTGWTSPTVERVVVSRAEVDNLMRGLAGARHAVSAEEFHRFVSKHASALTEVLRPFGYQGCRRTALGSIDDFDRAHSAWSARSANHVRLPTPSVGPPLQPAPLEEDATARQRMWQAAATDPIAAAFIGAGALVSATVGRLFGFAQDPRRAAAGGQMTSMLVHTVGGAGANRTIDSEPVPIELQRTGPRQNVASTALLIRGGLDAHEALGGHLLAKHVGIPRFALEVRLHAEPRLKYASTFESRAEAEVAIASVMAQRSADIQTWVASGAKGIEPFEGGFTGGFILVRGASETIVGSRARVVLRGDGRGDFFILTGYVLP